VALVTGGASGVGAAAVRWFVDHGHDVVINYRARAAEAEALAAWVHAAGATAELAPGDVADDAACRRMAGQARARFGRLDVLVNSAAKTVFNALDDLDAINAADFAGVYAVNVIGAYQMTRAVTPLMRAGGGGAVVMVSSIGATNGTGSSYAYLASKGALNTLTLALARNLAPAIRVNGVLPGLIESDWLRNGIGDEGYERARAGFIAASALERAATPEDVAAVIGWLATAAPLMTGQLVVADGGLLLGRPPRLK